MIWLSFFFCDIGFSPTVFANHIAKKRVGQWNASIYLNLQFYEIPKGKWFLSRTKVLAFTERGCDAWCQLWNEDGGLVSFASQQNVVAGNLIPPKAEILETIRAILAVNSTPLTFPPPVASVYRKRVPVALIDNETMFRNTEYFEHIHHQVLEDAMTDCPSYRRQPLDLLE